MRTTLYLGTDPTQFESEGRAQGHLIHYPIIKIVPRTADHPEIKQAFDAMGEYTHLLFTSKNAVKVFFENFKGSDLKSKTVIAIGQVTAAHLAAQGLLPQFTAEEETQEGVVKLLETLDLKDAYFFLPRSSLSRPVLVHFFESRNVRFVACDLYDTVTQELLPRPDLEKVDEIIFTSPSTVKAFMEIFKKLPAGKKLLAVGPVTQEALKQQL
jgi:uroporphyrinogen-III synthase